MKPMEQNILIIDDDPFILELMSEIILELGYAPVKSAANGRAALDLIDANGVDFNLILCDLEMPEMDGIELMRHLGARGFNGGIVLMTGTKGQILDAVVDLGKVHALRMLGTLTKPVTAATLKHLLEQQTEALAKEKSVAKPLYEITATELKRAFDSDALTLVYQPQVDIRTGQAVGVEVLVRWNHPCLGKLLPDQFISLSERFGLIDRLSRRVFELAVAQGARWRAEGIFLDMSVNLSMQNLMDLSLPDQFFQVANRFGFPLASLTLELTESQLASHPPSALEILARFRMKGVSLSIDDFGTGYANLENLSKFPFTELKIDRCFVANAPVNQVAKEILITTAALAKKLHLRLVAEGVENRQQWDVVKETGYDLVQGYFIARPMTADKLVEWLKQSDGVGGIAEAASPLAISGPKPRGP
jgi:EAL domain-containing protein (putative c-di-GMP-specific phosphodiesterase class I)/DNA-binding NarL/FixJ family response regulator